MAKSYLLMVKSLVVTAKSCHNPSIVDQVPILVCSVTMFVGQIPFLLLKKNL